VLTRMDAGQRPLLPAAWPGRLRWPPSCSFEWPLAQLLRDRQRRRRGRGRRVAHPDDVAVDREPEIVDQRAVAVERLRTDARGRPHGVGGGQGRDVAFETGE